MILFLDCIKKSISSQENNRSIMIKSIPREIKAYLSIIKTLKSSTILNSISSRNEATECAYDLLYLPVCRLSQISDTLASNNLKDSDIKSLLSKISSDSNAVWYAIDCRCDIPSMIPVNKVISISPDISQIINEHFDLKFGSVININDIHSLAGNVEIYIEETLLKNN